MQARGWIALANPQPTPEQCQAVVQWLVMAHAAGGRAAIRAVTLPDGSEGLLVCDREVWPCPSST
jgi:hypothetical protein